MLTESKRKKLAKYITVIREKRLSLTPYRLGIAMQESGDKYKCPYLKGSRGERLFFDGVNYAMKGE